MPTSKTRWPWRASAPTLATMRLGVGAGRVVVDGAAAVTLRNASCPQPGAPLRTPRPGGTARPGGPGREPSGGSAGCCVYGGGGSESGYAACSRPYANSLGKGTGRTPPVEELRRRRRADGVLGAVGPLGGRQALGNPAQWPRRALGSVTQCRSMSASRGLLGSRRVPARLVEAHRRVPAEPLEPISSRSTTELGEGDREVGGGCGRAGRAGARTGRAGA